MTATIHKLPTASKSYYTVRKVGGRWDVQLVTPVQGLSALRTTLAVTDLRQDAVEHGRTTAAKMRRPFIERRI